jgi:hypothetical protein
VTVASPTCFFARPNQRQRGGTSGSAANPPSRDVMRLIGPTK